MGLKCKVCNLGFETQNDFELHRIAHILKDIEKNINLSTKATLKALEEAQP